MTHRPPRQQRPSRPSRHPRSGLAAIAVATAVVIAFLGTTGLGALAPQHAWAQAAPATSATP
ncbi:MAG: hypothetical protein WAP57_13775, partial [Aquabacterium commune]